MNQDAGYDRRSRTARSPAALSHWEEPTEKFSILRLANIGLRNRRLLAGMAITGAALSVAVALVMPRAYTTSATFMSQSVESQLSQFAGLASQFGFTLPRQGATQSPEFYADLLQSRAILDAVVETQFQLERDENGGRVRGDLAVLFGVDGDTRELRLARAREELRKRLAVRAKPETGVVEFSVRTRWPTLSRDIGQRVLEVVGHFNLETRQSQASAERAFSGERLAAARQDLQRAEDSLAAFLQRNRLYENAPDLRFEYERLHREVGLRQQVFTALAQSHEQARIEEVRNTPVLTVIDPPELAAEPDSRHLPLKGALGFLLGALIGGVWVLVRDFTKTAEGGEDDEEYREFVTLRHETGQDLRRVWHNIRSGFRTPTGR